MGWRDPHSNTAARGLPNPGDEHELQWQSCPQKRHPPSWFPGGARVEEHLYVGGPDRDEKQDQPYPRRTPGSLREQTQTARDLRRPTQIDQLAAQRQATRHDPLVNPGSAEVQYPGDDKNQTQQRPRKWRTHVYKTPSFGPGCIIYPASNDSPAGYAVHSASRRPRHEIIRHFDPSLAFPRLMAW